MNRDQINVETVKKSLAAQWVMLQTGLVSVALIIPLALLSLEGWLLVLGILYAVLYFLVFVVPSSFAILIIYDTLRVAFDRPSFILGEVFRRVVEEEEGEAPVRPAAASTERQFLLALWRYGSPLLLLMGELLLLVMRLRPAPMKRIISEAAEKRSAVSPIAATGAMEGEIEVVREFYDHHAYA